MDQNSGFDVLLAAVARAEPAELPPDGAPQDSRKIIETSSFGAACTSFAALAASAASASAAPASAWCSGSNEDLELKGTKMCSKLKHPKRKTDTKEEGSGKLHHHEGSSSSSSSKRFSSSPSFQIPKNIQLQGQTPRVNLPSQFSQKKLFQSNSKNSQSLFNIGFGSVSSVSSGLTGSSSSAGSISFEESTMPQQLLKFIQQTGIHTAINQNESNNSNKATITKGEFSELYQMKKCDQQLTASGNSGSVPRVQVKNDTLQYLVQVEGFVGDEEKQQAQAFDHLHDQEQQQKQEQKQKQKQNHREEEKDDVMVLDIVPPSSNAGCASEGKSDTKNGLSKSDTKNGLSSSIVYTFGSYSDYSQEPDSIPLTPLSTPNRCPSFIVKLYAILSHPELSHVITWLPHGRSWTILDPVEFEVSVIPKYMGKGVSLISFTKRVIALGFQRTATSSSTTATTSSSSASYFHECFLRGRPHLMKLIESQDTKAKKNSYNNSSTPKRKACEKSSSNNNNIITEADLQDIANKRPLPRDPLPITNNNGGNDESVLIMKMIDAFLVENGPTTRLPVSLCRIRRSKRKDAAAAVAKSRTSAATAAASSFSNSTSTSSGALAATSTTTATSTTSSRRRRRGGGKNATAKNGPKSAASRKLEECEEQMAKRLKTFYPGSFTAVGPPPPTSTPRASQTDVTCSDEGEELTMNFAPSSTLSPTTVQDDVLMSNNTSFSGSVGTGVTNNSGICGGMINASAMTSDSSFPVTATNNYSMGNAGNASSFPPQVQRNSMTMLSSNNNMNNGNVNNAFSLSMQQQQQQQQVVANTNNNNVDLNASMNMNMMNFLQLAVNQQRQQRDYNNVNINAAVAMPIKSPTPRNNNVAVNMNDHTNSLSMAMNATSSNHPGVNSNSNSNHHNVANNDVATNAAQEVLRELIARAFVAGIIFGSK